MQQNPKRFILYFVFATTLSLFSFFCLLNFTNPFTATNSVLVFFYLNVCILTLGVTTLIGYYFRKRFLHKGFATDFLNSARQGLLLALFISSALLLLANGLFYWWVLLSLILLFIFIELFWLFN